MGEGVRFSIKNLGTYISLGIFAIGIIAGWGKMQANAANNEKRVDKVEVKVEELKTKIDKQEVTQEYIKKQSDNIDNKIDKLMEIVIELKKDN